MKLKEILKQLESYKTNHQVIAMTENGEIISTTFFLHTCPIHSSLFSVFGAIDNMQHLHVISNKSVIKQLNCIPNESTKRVYGWQALDYVEPEERELLFIYDIKSIYCEKYKYLQPYYIFKNSQDQIIIRCKGK